MALQKCPECNGKISSTANRCPHCGIEGDDLVSARATENCVGCLALLLAVAAGVAFLV